MDYGTTFIGGGGGLPFTIESSSGYSNGGGYVGGGGWGGPTFGAAAPGLATTEVTGVSVGGSWSPEPQSNLPIIYGYNPVLPANGVLPVGYGAPLPANLGAQSLAPAAAPAPAAGQPRPAAPAQPRPATAPAQPKPAATVPKPADPKPPATPAKPKTVTVGSGDNLTKIAAANGTTWQKLYDANKAAIGSDPNVIKTGIELKIPA